MLRSTTCPTLPSCCLSNAIWIQQYNDIASGDDIGSAAFWQPGIALSCMFYGPSKAKEVSKTCVVAARQPSHQVYTLALSDPKTHQLASMLSWSPLAYGKWMTTSVYGCRRVNIRDDVCDYKHSPGSYNYAWRGLNKRSSLACMCMQEMPFLWSACQWSGAEAMAA